MDFPATNGYNRDNLREFFLCNFAAKKRKAYDPIADNAAYADARGTVFRLPTA